MGRQLCSPLYVNLRNRVSSLASHFLPEESDPLGNYSDNQQIDASACVLLTHAEVETYLEGLSRKLGAVALAQIEEACYSELSSAFLFAAGSDKKVLKGNPSSLENASKAFLGIRNEQINANNGIKENNLNSLFSPFSLTDVRFSDDLIPALNSFGALRGRCAHTSAIGTKKIIDCYEIRTQINDLLDLLKEFDSIYSKWVI